MAVPDANDVSGAAHRDKERQSPILHSAMHNLLIGLRDFEDIEVEVAYGRMNPEMGEDRWDGCIHYTPVRYKPIPIPGMGGPYIARTMALLRHIKRRNPDVVHGQGTERESGLVAALCGRPSVLTLHGNFREIAASMNFPYLSYFRFAAMIESFCLPRVSGVHCISSATKRSVEAKAKQTWVIPNAVHEDFFKLERKTGSHPYVICVAGISEWKNQLLLVEASDQLHLAFPDLEVHFIGTCHESSSYGKEFLESIRNRPWCHHHAQCHRDEILRHMEKTTCSVLPSTQENFGLVVAEALAAGIPCLGSNIGGIPDIISPGVDGELFDPTSVEELAQQLIKTHMDHRMVSRYAAEGKISAQRRFSSRAIANAHIVMYHEILAKKE